MTPRVAPVPSWKRFQHRLLVAVVCLASIVGLDRPAAGNTTNNLFLQGSDGRGTNAQVIQRPKLYVVFWQLTAVNDSLGVVADVKAFLGALGGTRWAGLPSNYPGNGAGPNSIFTTPVNATYPVATWTDTTNPLPPTPDEATRSSFWAAADAEVGRALAHFSLSNDPNAIIILVFPSFPGGAAFANQHTYAETGGTFVTPYIGLFYPPLQPTGHDADGNLFTFDQRAYVSVDLQHELMETITDPRHEGIHNGWRDNIASPIGDEVADKVNFLQAPLGDSVLAIDESNFGLRPLQGMQVKLLPKQSSGDAALTIFTLVPGWNDELAALQPGPVADQSISAASWAFGRPLAGMGPADESGPAKFVVASNGHLQYTIDGSNGVGPTVWQDWGTPSSGRTLSGTPAVVSWSPDRFDVFCVASDGHLWHIYADNRVKGAWDDWGAPPEGSFFQSPVAVSYGPVELDVFAVTSAKNLWQKHWEGTVSHGTTGTFTSFSKSDWINWGQPAEGIASGPGAVAWIQNYQPHVRVYVVNNSGNTPHGLSYAQADGWTLPTGPSSITWTKDSLSASSPNLKTVAPSVANITVPYTFDVFALDSNNSVVHRATFFTDRLDGTTDTWETLGKPANVSISQQPIGATSPGSHYFFVDVRTSSNGIWELQMMGANNPGGTSQWVEVGGSISSSSGVSSADF